MRAGMCNRLCFTRERVFSRLIKGFYDQDTFSDSEKLLENPYL